MQNRESGFELDAVSRVGRHEVVSAEGEMKAVNWVLHMRAQTPLQLRHMIPIELLALPAYPRYNTKVERTFRVQRRSACDSLLVADRLFVANGVSFSKRHETVV
jgi:hypothetical protein